MDDLGSVWVEYMARLSRKDAYGAFFCLVFSPSLMLSLYTVLHVSIGTGIPIGVLGVSLILVCNGALKEFFSAHFGDIFSFHLLLCTQGLVFLSKKGGKGFWFKIYFRGKIFWAIGVCSVNPYVVQQREILKFQDVLASNILFH